ncbi:Glutaredoxin [Flavobacteriaceae bacterium MAR_2010_188]|nr:Glutaredoxin [Flavobacteriaceae bacterium MAR_2010_188]
MKSFFLSLFALLLCVTANSQNDKVDVVSERTDAGFTVKGINNTDIQQEITLTLDVYNLSGYTKPITILIPAKSTIKIVDLTKVPNERNDVKMKFSHKPHPNEAEAKTYNKKIKADLLSQIGASDKGIVVFVKPECSRCTELSTLLKDKSLEFKQLNVKEKPEVNGQMWKLLRTDFPSVKSISMPVVSVDGELFYEIVDLKKFVETLNQKKK